MDTQTQQETQSITNLELLAFIAKQTSQQNEYENQNLATVSIPKISEEEHAQRSLRSQLAWPTIDF